MWWPKILHGGCVVVLDIDLVFGLAKHALKKRKNM